MRMSQATTSPTKSPLSTTSIPSSNRQSSDSTTSCTVSSITDTTETPNATTANTNINTKPIHQTYDDISSAPMTCLEMVGPHEELHYFLLTILRLSYTCPFGDVRHTFQHFIKTTLDTGVIPTPQPRHLSPSYFIPLEDIFSLESTSSAQTVISYPRPSNFSSSPWSQDASDGGDSFDTNKSTPIHSHHQHTYQHKHRHHHHHHHHPSRHRLPRVSSSFSSSSSSLWKSSNLLEQASSSSSASSVCSDRGDDSDYNEGYANDYDEACSMDDNSSRKSMTRGKSTGGRPSDEYVRQMLVKSYLDEGRLTNMYRVMSFFPTFYEIFHLTMNNIIKSSMGPLHRSWRIYLGIMASAEQQCQYLVSTLKLDFLQNGGDPLWLKGIHHCPEKLQRITGFLAKMARQPWQLTEDDILILMRVTNTGATRTGSAITLNMTWSKGELVQAILVISTFLSLSNFVLSCGIAPEMDMEGGYRILGSHGARSFSGIENELNDTMHQQQQQQQQPSKPSTHHYLSVEDELAIRAASSATGWYDSQISPKSSQTDDSDDDCNNDKSNGDVDQQQSIIESVYDSEEDNSAVNDGHLNTLYMDETTALISKLKSNKDTNKELHECLANLNVFSSAQMQQQGNPGTINDTTTIQMTELDEKKRVTVNAVYEDLVSFTSAGLTTDVMEYEEFEPGHPDYIEFMLSEYCWEDHGCDLVNHFLPGIGDDLDDEFIESLSITDWSIFHQVTDGAVDTSPLRNAIFFYVQQILGITKEDYHYADIPNYLGEQTRHYIQKVCRQPHLLDRHDWNSVGISLRPEEKCHMNLLIASSRKQALLCYGLSLVSHV
ncbi:PA26 p53-induced protein-domain-containing protein [Chlamydoabsidia padenii]|nr:PA26 p53-induced protein-domain-containing protein [Chlamydoabsidia padenii]